MSAELAGQVQVNLSREDFTYKAMADKENFAKSLGELQASLDEKVSQVIMQKEASYKKCCLFLGIMESDTLFGACCGFEGSASAEAVGKALLQLLINSPPEIKHFLSLHIKEVFDVTE